MARKILRKVGSVTPVNNTVIRFRAPLGTTVSRYMLRYTATFTISVAAATSLNEDNPYGYFRSVDLILNGSFPLRSHDGRGYFFLNRVMQKTAPQNTPVSATATGTYSIVAEFFIDLAMIDLQPPLDSAFWLDTRLLSSLEIVFTFGAEADIAVAGGATLALSAQNVDIYAEEIADVGGPLSRMRVARIQQAVAATGDLDIQLPALGPSYERILVHATSGATITDPIRQTSDDTVLNTLSLIADNIVRHADTIPYRSLRQDNKQLYNLETLPPGWAVLDFARSFNLRDLVLTARTRQIILRANIASAPANAFLQIYPMDALLVLRPQQQQGAAAAALGRR